MALWRVKVVERREAIMDYVVEAEDGEEAMEMAERGETVSEDGDDHDYEIRERSVIGDPERMEDEDDDR